MLTLKNLSWFMLLACTSVAHAGAVPESPPSRWNPKSFGVSATTEYFSSDANYDENRGSFSRLPNGQNITVFETRPRIRYAFTHALSTFVGTSYAQTRAVDLSTEETNTNINEVFGGVDFQMNRRWWRVVPEIEFSTPLDSSDTSAMAPMTGEGVSQLRAGVFLFKPYQKIRFESYLGFHYLGDGLAKRFVYSASTELALIHGFSIGGGIGGYETIIADEYSEGERQIQQVKNAGSAKFQSYNSALMEAKAWLGFRADRAFSFRLGYARSINGVRSAVGSSVLLSIAFNSPGDKERGRAIRAGYDIEEDVDEDVAPAQSGDGFRADPEVVDPELFEQEQQKKKEKQKPNESLDSTEKILEKRQ